MKSSRWRFQAQRLLGQLCVFASSLVTAVFWINLLAPSGDAAFDAIESLAALLPRKRLGKALNREIHEPREKDLSAETIGNLSPSVRVFGVFRG